MDVKPQNIIILFNENIFIVHKIKVENNIFNKYIL